jgi:DNA-binding beta-propeller fold protein YncE
MKILTKLISACFIIALVLSLSCGTKAPATTNPASSTPAKNTSTATSSATASSTTALTSQTVTTKQVSSTAPISSSVPVSTQVLTSFDTASGAVAVCFDGTYIWVANYGSNNISKLKASDGSLQATYKAGTNPQDIVFDGTYIWVANYGSNNVSKLKASDGSLIGTYTATIKPVPPSGCQMPEMTALPNSKPATVARQATSK